jgi:hypothetical protein
MRSQPVPLGRLAAPDECVTGIVLRCAQSISRFAFWQLSGATGGDGGYPSRIYSDGIEQIFGVPADEMAAGTDAYVARFVQIVPLGVV